MPKERIDVFDFPREKEKLGAGEREAFGDFRLQEEEEGVKSFRPKVLFSLRPTLPLLRSNELENLSPPLTPFRTL